MKKVLLLMPVLLLAVTGFLLMGCPSEAEEGFTIKDGEGVMTFEGGKFQYNFSDPVIKDGNEYEVVLTIEECDDAFIGVSLNGKICYKMDLSSNDEMILSGWNSAIPTTVSAAQSTYTWTFKAGDSHKDNLSTEKPATTPEGGHQYFSFTAQDGYNNFPSNVSFKVKGSFEVHETASVGELVSAGEITLGNEQETQGKGFLDDEDIALIRSMPENSIIRFSVSVVVNTGSAQPGYGVVGIAKDWGSGLSINVPGGSPVGPLDFTADIKISDILITIGESNAICINPYNGATVTKAELFKPAI